MFLLLASAAFAAGTDGKPGSPVFPAGFAPPGQNLFTPIEMLTEPGPNRGARAVETFERALVFQRKISFHPELDPSLIAVRDRLPPRQSTLIRAAALYSQPDIAWQRQAPDTHYVAVSGRPRETDYLYSLAPTYRMPEVTGDFAGIFALRPAKPAAKGDSPTSVIGELGGRLHLNTFGAAQSLDAGAAELAEVYGTLAAPWDTALGVYNEHDRAAEARFKRDLPSLDERLNHYFQIHNLLDEPRDRVGPYVVLNFDATVRDEALAPFPRLQSFYRRVAPRVTATAIVDDGSGKQWMREGFDRGHFRITFLIRDGKLTPMGADTRPAGPPLAIDKLATGHYRSTSSVRVTSLGMEFGLDDLSFATDFHRQADGITASSRMTHQPAIVAPPVVHQVMLLLAGEFLRVMAQGNGGHGVAVDFSSIGSGQTQFDYNASISAELRYSPALEFLARIGDRIADAHNEEVRREERRLSEEFFDAMVKDFQRARPALLAQDAKAMTGK